MIAATRGDFDILVWKKKKGKGEMMTLITPDCQSGQGGSRLLAAGDVDPVLMLKIVGSDGHNWLIVAHSCANMFLIPIQNDIRYS
jgi:hypothetical protein